jgi:hypothetical protein
VAGLVTADWCGPVSRRRGCGREATGARREGWRLETQTRPEVPPDGSAARCAMALDACAVVGARCEIEPRSRRLTAAPHRTHDRTQQLVRSSARAAPRGVSSRHVLSPCLSRVPRPAGGGRRRKRVRGDR